MKATIRIIMACLLSAASAARAEDVTWILPEFPPGFIRGPFRTGEGYGDRQLKFLIEHLPQFHHTVLNGSASRLWHEMEHHDGICTLLVAKLPEREKLAVFSARSFWGAANHMIVRTDRLGDFAPFRDKSGAVDLSRLASDGHLRGGYTDTSSYGSTIDAFIHDPDRKIPLEMTPHLRMPLVLLDKGRIDFVFGYYMEMTYYRQLNRLGDDFTALPILPEQVHQDGYVACSNQPLGHRVIAGIDALLAPDDMMLAYIAPLRDWYSAEDFEAAQKAVKSATPR
jgi:uncharacterized protein (TIGR02285 family)